MGFTLGTARVPCFDLIANLAQHFPQDFQIVLRLLQRFGIEFPRCHRQQFRCICFKHLLLVVVDKYSHMVGDDTVVQGKSSPGPDGSFFH